MRPKFDDRDPELLNMARLLYIGSHNLGYSEGEIFRMTPRKFFLLYDEFLEMHGVHKKLTGIAAMP